MKLDLTYQMLINFEPAIDQHQFTLRLLPRTASGHLIHRLQLLISGEHDHGRLHDGFGNRLISGCFLAPHATFEVSLQATIENTKHKPHEPHLHPEVFLSSTPLTRVDIHCLEQWKLEQPSNNPTDMAHRLTDLVHSRMEYQSGTTQVDHSAAELMQHPVGVCQDYAHLLIALLRQHRIPARYVAGVMQGEGQSHAWVEAFLDQEWVGIDPTHQHWITPIDPYVAFAVGRDFNDCPLNSGCFQGITKQNIHIQTQLSPH